MENSSFRVNGPQRDPLTPITEKLSLLTPEKARLMKSQLRILKSLSKELEIAAMKGSDKLVSIK